MATENLKEAAQWDAAHHTTLLVRKSERGFTAVFLRGNGTYSSESELSPEELGALLANVIKSSASHNTGSFVMGIDLAAQGTIGGPHPPGPGPGGYPPELLQGGAVDVHMEVRGLAEKVQLAQLANVKGP